MNNCTPIQAVLTIAGSDSGGGAGIQADLRTFNYFKTYGSSVLTAVTSQNPDEVRRVDILDVQAVKSQLETVLDLIPIRFAKTGMLANCEIIECVAKIVSERKLPLVVDPVMISSSGVNLLEDVAVSVMREKLFPLAAWLTPNIREAEIISERKINCFDDLAIIAMALYEQYKCNIILKSGHYPDMLTARDIVCYEGRLFSLSSPKVDIIGNTAHGTGCTLSAGLTANLALGKTWEQALINAKVFIYSSLFETRLLGEKLCQMYPPENLYYNQIILQQLI